jgi:hypothetical protein
MFGESAYDPTRAIQYTSFEDQLAAISTALDKGQIRGWGISNETAWGVTKWCAVAQQHGVHQPSVVQNALHLLCRTAEADVAEACREERVALQAYSPLAMGLLTGKYSRGEAPQSLHFDEGKAVGGWRGPEDSRLCRYRKQYAEAESRCVAPFCARPCKAALLKSAPPGPSWVTEGVVRLPGQPKKSQDLLGISTESISSRAVACCCFFAAASISKGLPVGIDSVLLAYHSLKL